MKDIAVQGAVACLLAGCAGLEVSEQTATDKVTKLQGIPIRIKVPVWVHETKILETGWQVQFMVAKPAEKSGEKRVLFNVPEAGPLLIECATPSDIRSEVERALTQVKKAGPSSEDALADQLRAALENIAAVKFAKSVGGCQRVVANTITQQSRVSDNTYYITNKIPLFGSGSGAFKMAEDGTLTEASTETVDETAKTILGLFPIREKLMMRWGLEKSLAPLILPAEKPYIIEADLTSVQVQYTLRRDVATSGTRPAIPADLTLDNTTSSPPFAELVSVEPVGVPAPAMPDKKAYQLKGTITPPKGEEK